MSKQLSSDERARRAQTVAMVALVQLIVINMLGTWHGPPDL